MFLLLAVGAIAALCALLWRAAAFALPTFLGFAVGFWSFHHGAGIASIVVGAVAGVGAFRLGKIAIRNRHPILRWLTAVVFVAPAAVAGYGIAMQLLDLTSIGDTWKIVLALGSGAATAITAFLRLLEPSDLRDATGEY